MTVRNDLSEIETRCLEIINSPYVRREIPAELEKLRALLLKVRVLAHDDVPGLIAEVKRLRSLNKRLEESAEAAEAVNAEAVSSGANNGSSHNNGVSQ